MHPPGTRPGYYVWGGLSPGHRECGSASLYWGLETEPPIGSRGAQPPVGVSGTKSPEAESSVAFEGSAEEPNLTLLPAF